MPTKVLLSSLSLSCSSVLSNPDWRNMSIAKDIAASQKLVCIVMSSQRTEKCTCRWDDPKVRLLEVACLYNQSQTPEPAALPLRYMYDWNFPLVSMFVAGTQYNHSWCQVLHCVQRESFKVDIRSAGRNYLQKSKESGSFRDSPR